MTQQDVLTGGQVTAARSISHGVVAFGTVLTVLGIFSIIAPLFSGIAVTVLVGGLLTAAGAAQLVFSFRADTFGRGVGRFFFGGVNLVAGIICFAMPESSLGILTMILAASFVAGGLMDIFLSFKTETNEGRGWIWLSAVASIAIGIFIIAQWPVSGLWAVGVYVGVRLLLQGFMMVGLGRTGESVITQVQDTRIEVLERRLRAEAHSLQEVQAILATQSQMLLAMGDEMRTKLSAAEVDPAMQKLNDTLGDAREKMEEAASAAEHTWEEASKRADKAFGALRDGMREVSDRLKGTKQD